MGVFHIAYTATTHDRAYELEWGDFSNEDDAQHVLDDMKASAAYLVNDAKTEAVFEENDFRRKMLTYIGNATLYTPPSQLEVLIEIKIPCDFDAAQVTTQLQNEMTDGCLWRETKKCYPGIQYTTDNITDGTIICTSVGFMYVSQQYM